LKRAGRVFILAFVVMVVVAFVGIVSVARELSSVTQGTAQFAPLGLPMLIGSRSGSVSTLSPQPGLALLLAIPLLAAGLTAWLSRSRRGERKDRGDGAAATG
jgi:hypothetical protein